MSGSCVAPVSLAGQPGPCPPEEQPHPCGYSACSKPATKKCSRCRAIHYCSKPCSDANWRHHKPLCKPSTTSTAAATAFRLTSLPGKGLGLVAVRSLAPGELVITEEPLIVFTDGEPMGEILARFEELSEAEQTVVLGLYDPGEDETNRTEGVTEERHKKFLRISWANGLQLSGFSEHGAPGSGLYATVSRLNHSCAPNVVWSWREGDRSRRTKQVRVCSDIPEGSELCLSYIQQGSEFLTREERRERLHNWFPRCGCVVCGLTGEELEKSDSVRKHLARLHLEVRSYCKQGRREEAVQTAWKKVEVMETVLEQVVLKFPWALLDYCELAAVLQLQGERKEQSMARARDMVETQGDSALYKFRKKCSRIDKIVAFDKIENQIMKI